MAKKERIKFQSKGDKFLKGHNKKKQEMNFWERKGRAKNTVMFMLINIQYFKTTRG